MTEFGKSPAGCVASPLAIAVSRILRAAKLCEQKDQ